MEKQELSFTKEVVIGIKRVSKVVKGGKRLSFNAMVVVGDQQGSVGVALGKAREVQLAIQKAIYKAKKNIIKVPLNNTTIPHEIIGYASGAKILLKPAAPGTGLIASNTVRSVLECCGIKDILSKCLGSTNHINVVYATIDALSKLNSKEQTLKLRGKL